MTIALRTVAELWLKWVRIDRCLRSPVRATRGALSRRETGGDRLWLCESAGSRCRPSTSSRRTSGASWSRGSARPTTSGARPYSRSRTGTWAFAEPLTRAGPPTRLECSSVAFMSNGRFCMPRKRTGSPALGRRSSTCPTRRSFGYTSTTSRCWWPPRGCGGTRASWICLPGRWPASWCGRLRPESRSRFARVGAQPRQPAAKERVDLPC